MSTDHETPHNTEELKQGLHEHDDWFRHSPADPAHQESHGDFNPFVVLVFLAITMAVVVGTIVLVIPWFSRMVQAEKVAVREENVVVMEEILQLRSRWDGQLYGDPEWIDQRDNTVRIPIDIAMDEVVKRYESAR